LLRQGQINLNQGVIRILGKGGRERLIPLGGHAKRALRDFTGGMRAGPASRKGSRHTLYGMRSPRTCSTTVPI